MKADWLLRIAIILAGIWNVGDGVCSIVYYWRQSPQEHLVRVIRIAFGALLLVCLYLTWGPMP